MILFCCKLSIDREEMFCSNRLFENAKIVPKRGVLSDAPCFIDFY